MTRILVVHARGGVGDVVLSTPVIEALHRGYPDPQITMLVRSGAAGVVEVNPFLHDRIVVREGVWDQGQPYRDLVRDVRSRRFDVGVVLWSKAPEAWLLARARIPVRVGQAGRLLYSFLYTHQVQVRSERGDTTSHWVDIQLDYARRLGLATDGLKPVLRVSAAAREQAAARLMDGTRYIGFSIGKGLALTPERWPVDAFAGYANAVGEATGATIVLTGAPSEAAVVAAAAERLRVPFLNLAGKTGLLELAAVIERCDAFVCPDSGPMHMAAALGVPTVGIFAMRCEFPDRWRPYGGHLVRPEPVTCPVGCQKETCATFACYRAVQSQWVVDAVLKGIGDRVRS